MTAVELMLSLIRSAVTGKQQEVIDSINNETLEEIYKIAETHNIAHIIAFALSKNQKLGNDEISKKFTGTNRKITNIKEYANSLKRKK